MELLECLATIAKKLEITDDNILALHCFNRALLGKLGIRTAYAILGDLVDRYELRDDADAPTYGTQLVKKGILTPAEGYLFAEGYLLNGTQAKEQPPSIAEVGQGTAPDDAAGDTEKAQTDSIGIR